VPAQPLAEVILVPRAIFGRQELAVEVVSASGELRRSVLERPVRREKSGRERDTGARMNKSLKEDKSRAADQAPDVCSSLRRSPAPTNNLAHDRHVDNPRQHTSRANSEMNAPDEGECDVPYGGLSMIACFR
jgi:hypothetical protein